jgi:aryl-alcohol dehydrogenase-like predicted oxidoreductase
MRYRLFGQTGLRVSDLFLGAMAFGGDRATPEESRRIVDLYAESGGNVIDTADAYGRSESVLGETASSSRRSTPSPATGPM